jgi:hypothetical protein
MLLPFWSEASAITIRDVPFLLDPPGGCADPWRMTATRWLRVAAVIMALFAAGHTMGGRSAWSPLGETPVLEQMRTFRFDAMGTSRSYFEFYLGFGYVISVLQFTQAVLLWQLAGLTRADARRARPLIGTFLVAAIASTIVTWRYIFLVPVIFSIIYTVAVALAFVAAGRARAADQSSGM